MFTSELCVSALPNPDLWALERPLVWVDGKDVITVPAGFITDLASIPKGLRNILDVNGRSRRAAVLHDYAYHSHDLTRAAADDLLRRALIAEGEGWFAARVYWLGVRAGGGAAYDNHPLGLLPVDFATMTDYWAAMPPAKST